MYQKTALPPATPASVNGHDDSLRAGTFYRAAKVQAEDIRVISAAMLLAMNSFALSVDDYLKTKCDTLSAGAVAAEIVASSNVLSPSREVMK